MIISIGGFESYEVSAWQENGLTSRIIAVRRSSERIPRTRAWIAAIVVSLTSIAIPEFEASASTAQATLHWEALIAKSEAGLAPSARDRLPKGYWKGIIAEI